MILDLQRAFSPEEYGNEEECGICRQPFHTEVILTQAATDFHVGMGHVCRACMEYLANRSPEYFPTIEQYEALLKQYPEPMWSSSEKVPDLWDEQDVGEKYEASWVWRAPG